MRNISIFWGHWFGNISIILGVCKGNGCFCLKRKKLLKVFILWHLHAEYNLNTSSIIMYILISGKFLLHKAMSFNKILLCSCSMPGIVSGSGNATHGGGGGLPSWGFSFRNKKTMEMKCGVCSSEGRMRCYGIWHHLELCFLDFLFHEWA